jgi:hypothetical protein
MGVVEEMTMSGQRLTLAMALNLSLWLKSRVTDTGHAADAGCAE